MTLTGSYQISEVLIKVLNVSTHLVTNVWIRLGSWCIVDIAAIRKNSWIVGGDKIVGILGDLFFDCIRDVVR